ncbi:MAG: putative 2-aminoethylphosphonate ABC transporter ATP-binding protein [Candidatus Rokubacteria bacterium]|nr:putative 2-aminoethylphosphonate ABC transporter ATP-binding protein [Candidatus Rokubacteria bacterium]
MGSAVESSPYLRIERLTKRFGSFTALREISLDINEGEFVCFLGPSGCGKTTLLRAIAGLDIQTSGRVEQAARDISALPPTARDFGIVFQSYALFPNLTVWKNVAYGLENAKMKKADVTTRVRELLELVGLQDQGHKYPAQLSGGQQQRVALARALATSPGLLLLDEPLSALDAKVRVYLRHEIKQLQRRLGVTTIMVTHDQEEALTMADRIVVMNHGVIEQVGTPLEVYREPASAFVADFVGLMNFVPGTIIGPDAVRCGQLELACEAGGFARGTGVTIAIRPEDLVVQNVQGSEQNAFTTRIETLVFLGSFFRADLVGDGMGEMRLRADLSTDLVRRLGLAEGRALSVILPRDRLRIYPGSAMRG